MESTVLAVDEMLKSVALTVKSSIATASKMVSSSPDQVPLKRHTVSLMPLGEPGPYLWQVHAKPAHREGNTGRVLVAIAVNPGLDDASQNDPDCAGIPVVAGHRAQIPQCHPHVEPVAGRAAPGPPRPVQVDDCIRNARLS
ncbi:MAG TPA: hypothetical protein VIJ07_24255 [Dermatophilaceae bacterium]